jgi:uncharacterized membrane protein
MDWQTFFVITGLLSLLFFMEQRADPTARNVVRYFTVFSMFLITIYAWWYEALREALFAFITAMVLTFLYWALIGRYNPASSSDDIRVLGMDD